MLLLAEVRRMLDEDGRPSPSIQEALSDLDQRAEHEIYRRDDLGVAEVAERNRQSTGSNVVTTVPRSRPSIGR